LLPPFRFLCLFSVGLLAGILIDFWAFGPRFFSQPIDGGRTGSPRRG
jgi:hypothetical protein